MGVDPVHVVKIAGGAATSADDDVVHCLGAVEHLPFQFAESLFAIAVEKKWDRGVVVLFEKMVEVDKTEAHLLCKASTDGGLAAVHIAQEVEFHGDVLFVGHGGPAATFFYPVKYLGRDF